MPCLSAAGHRPQPLTGHESGQVEFDSGMAEALTPCSWRCSRARLLTGSWVPAFRCPGSWQHWFGSPWPDAWCTRVSIFPSASTPSRPSFCSIAACSRVRAEPKNEKASDREVEGLHFRQLARRKRSNPDRIEQVRYLRPSALRSFDLLAACEDSLHSKSTNQTESWRDRIMPKATQGRRSSMILSGHDSVVAGCGSAALRHLRLRNQLVSAIRRRADQYAFFCRRSVITMMRKSSQRLQFSRYQIVMANPLLQARVAAPAIHLRPAGHARPGDVPGVVMRHAGLEALDQLRPLWTRSDQAHIPFKNVPKLGHLINVPLAHEGANSEPARIVFLRPLWPILLFRIRAHTSQLDHPKKPAVEPHSNLAVEDRAP